MLTIIGQRRRLLALLGRLPAALSAGLAGAMLVGVLLPAASAAAVGWVVVEVARVGSDRSDLLVPLVVAVVVLVANLVAESILSPLQSHASMRVNGAIRREVRTALAAPDSVEHVDDVETQKAASLLVNDVYLFNIGAAAVGQLWLMFRFVGAAVSWSLVASFSPVWASWALIVLLVQRAILRRQYANVVAAQSADSALSSRAAGYWMSVVGEPAGGAEMRLFGFDRWALDHLNHHRRVLVRISEGLYRHALPKQWITFVLSGAGIGVPTFFAAVSALDGSMTIGHLAVTLGAIASLATIGTMGYEAFSIEAAVPQLDALEDLLALAANASDSRGSEPGLAFPTVPSIEFDDVWFAYPGTDRAVLQGLSVKLGAGEKVAIVGENGAGKTTLLMLLCGFYRPDRGRILVDGVDLSSLPADQWRKAVAVVLQDFVRFPLTVRDNVALADAESASLADLESAAAAAGSLELIEGLDFGWDTVLSREATGGAELSGGQWQRIALTRSLYAAQRGAGVLVLDEPTAHLDVTAETELFDRLLSHAADRTAIVVSHRFSTVRRADRIIVIADGVVAEDGSHEGLHSVGGIYADMYDLQATAFHGGRP